jgi:hypothetical protein
MDFTTNLSDFAAAANSRPFRAGEVYSLTCACGAVVEIPVVGPHVCPACGAALNIQWRNRL